MTFIEIVTKVDRVYKSITLKSQIEVADVYCNRLKHEMEKDKTLHCMDAHFKRHNAIATIGDLIKVLHNNAIKGKY